MGMSRRKFFGAAAGGVVAAPAVAKSALDGVGYSNARFVENAATGWLGASGMGKDVPFVETESHIRQRLTELVSERSDVVERNIVPPSLFRDMRIDSLRSVSVTNRARMIAEARAAENLAHELKWIDRRIEEMKSKLGLFGQLI